MAPRRFTLRSSHLLMWSSPLLLLVLVFTLNSRPLHSIVTTTTRPSPATTTPTATTPTTLPPTTTTSTTSTLASPQVLTSTTSHRVPVATSTTTSTSTTTTVSHAPSSDATTTSVVAIDTSNEEKIHGQLTLESPDVMVPLRGPGQWTLLVSHEVSTSLECDSHSSVVSTTVRVVTNQKCQLVIITLTGAPTTWILRPVQ